MPIWVSVQGAQQMRELSARLKEAGRGDLQKQLRKRIKDAGQPVVRDLQGAVMRVRVTRGADPFARRTQETGVAPRRSTARWGRRSTALRARTAKATGISMTRRGIRIVVSARKLGDYGTTLPKYLDGTIRGYKNWRHPVFGDENTWVTQHGSAYFFNTITAHRAAFRAAVFAAMDDIAKEITR